ncbi:MAG: DUF5110 domain-containing protein [Clostridia bacterium]|nr:DUF5110 domain-containing protein [Clostridia bacterium]
MASFNHPFSAAEQSVSSRRYTSENITAQLDFLGESCLRVAIWRTGDTLLPTVCINPDNTPLPTARDRLSTAGFSLCAPQVTAGEDKEKFLLPCGVEVTLHKHNFLLEYRRAGEVLFADRAPLAYNFGGEFGAEQYHYITRSRGEAVFGLGDKGGALNKAGRAFRIETTDCMGYDAAQSDPLYKHIPFFMCENEVGCYGIFYDTAATSYIDCGKEINNYYPAYKYFKTEDNCLVYYVFFGSKLSVLQQFARACGKQAFPPRWSFDYCASTMAYTDAPDAAAQMDGFLEKLGESKLSCSGFYLSSGYTSVGERRYVFHWDKSKFPQPEAFIEKFEQRGIHLIPNIKPAFLDSHPLYAALAAKGYFVKNADGTPFVTQFWDGLGSYLDFTNPAAAAFWQAQVREQLLDKGIIATWNDNNEFDIKDNTALAAGFGSGAVPAGALRPYLTYLMVAASYRAQVEKRPQLRPFLSSRSGNIAVRRLAQTWSGDNRTAFEDLRYCHNIGLTMSLSGLAFYGHDLGGFLGAMPSRELLLRWLQHGIFEPRFTIHSWNEDGSATMPWSYPDILPAVRGLFAQRRQLIPYLYNCAYRAVEEEIPLNAPPLLYYDDKALYEQTDAMMVGTDILVGFVFDEGAPETSVYLPAGEAWYCADKCYQGGQSVRVPLAPEDPVPYFVKAGSVVATEEGGIVLSVYPLKEGKFESRFFWDDGESFAYQSGECVDLHITVECDADTVTVSCKNSGNTAFTPAFRLCAADKRTFIVK